ncbi:hypothetical protein OIU84_016421 [Salix udensis]|uniref:DUF3511 domain protein n=1 Tax=Salix udensis TaxID=889485 RepID=A0AAD6JA88_9ROSI|nr:hypothetical protein OIU84_016421 [Salix udensis]
MDGYGYGSDQRGERRLEIVSGKGFGFGNSNQIYATRPHSPNVASIPPRRSQSSSSRPWGGMTDPEMKRKKRIAKYKVYTVEGKVKASLRRGICWIKNKCSKIIHGY